MPSLSLNSHEARVLGVLIEKAYTVPDQYPMTLNSATLGSNQKNNRWPVTDYSSAEVHVALQGLVMKHLAGRVQEGGQRVEKYRHNAREVFEVDDGALAVLAELLMRGPQQPGELRTRAERMVALPTLEKLQEKLVRLMEKGYVKRLDPLPGERAERYAQMLCPDAHPLDVAGPVASKPAAAPRADLEARVLTLENQMKELRERFDALARQLGG
ncbi:MAG: DUF480 domain-containing protein [Planctomycetes bacterium]|nr:DUF480 domain-containing protein [Planctomycetota bacterium]